MSIKKIYTVNIFTGFELNEFYAPECVFSCKNVRTPGYFLKMEDAKKCVEENWGDIYETVYDYACIEEIEPGLYPCPVQKWWYKWDNGKYRPIQVQDLLEEGLGELDKGDTDMSFIIG